MTEEKKDFKEVKVKIQGGQRETETLDRSMLFSGVNIFGALTQMYLSKKEEMQFSAPAQQLNSDALKGASSNSMMSLEAEVLSIFKRMQKRDSVTKIKACAELANYVNALDASAEELPNILTFYLYHMCRILMNEHDKLVREAAHKAFQAFVQKCKRKLGPHIKKVFPIWYCGFFDPSPEVAKLARQNFDLAFQQEKQPEVFNLAYKMFLNFAHEQLQQSASDDSEDKTEKKESEEIFERINCQVLQALANSFEFTKNWPEAEQLTYKTKLLDILNLHASGKKKLGMVWGFFDSKHPGPLKSACLQFAGAFITNIPAEVVKEHIPQIAPAIFGLISEQNSVLQTSLWRDALFTLAKSFPECWTHVAIKKDLLPKLYKCLKEAAFGAPSSLYSNFVKFLSVCPLYRLAQADIQLKDPKNKASFKDRCNLLREVLLALYSGIKNDEAVSYHAQLVDSLCDSVTFVLLKRVSVLEDATERQFAMKQLEKVIQVPLMDFVESYQKPQSKQQQQRTVRSSFAKRYARILSDLAERELQVGLYKEFCETLFAELDVSKRNAMRFVSQVLLACDQCSKQYRDLAYETLVKQVLRTQSSQITEMVSSLSKANLDDCCRLASCHRRLAYTIVKRQISIQLGPEDLLKVGDLFTTVTEKEKLARKVLNVDQLSLFKDLESYFVDINVLYLSQGLEGKEWDLSQILNAIGLLESPSSDIKEVDPLQEAIFRPDFPKISLQRYFAMLRDDQNIHDLLAGAVSVNLMEEHSICLYAELISGIISDSVTHKDQGIFNEADLDLFMMVAEKTIEDPKADLRKVVAYFQSIRALCQAPQAEYDQIREFIMMQVLRIKTKSRENENLFQQLWAIFVDSASGNQAYQSKVIDLFTQEVATLIQNPQSKLARINHVSRCVNLFVELRPNSKVSTLCQILLHETLFSYVETNYLPVKMFKDLFLRGEVGFDVQELFTNTDYVWLAALLIEIKNLTSLSQLMDLRKQLVLFVETEVVPALVNIATSPEHKGFVIKMFGYLTNQEKLHTLEYLAQMVVDPGENFDMSVKPALKIDDFKQIFMENGAQTAQELLNANFDVPNGKNIEILVILLQKFAYQILDLPILAELFKRVRANLEQGPNQSLCEVQIGIYMALEKWFTPQQDDAETFTFQVKLMSSLLQMKDPQIRQTAISLCNKLLERYPNQKVREHTNSQELEGAILDLLHMTGKVPCQDTIRLCKVIRKTLNWSQSLQDAIVAPLIETVKESAEVFDKALQQLSTKAGTVVRPFEIEMLQELAETLLVCPQAITQLNIAPQMEDHLFYLLGCSFEALQKAAYILLKFLFENFVPPVLYASDDEADLKNLMAKNESEKIQSIAYRNISPNLLRLIDEAPSTNEEDEQIKDAFNVRNQVDTLIYGESEEGQMNNHVFGYLLAWNATLLKIEHGRIKATLNENGEYLKVLGALTETLETDSTIYQMMLVSLVPYLPRYGKKPQDFVKEFATFSPEYCELKDTFQTKLLCLTSLINFMKSFPSLGRKFYQDCDKQLLDMMLPYIKSVISPAILENEIKKIEMSQVEFGSKNDLSFVLFKSTKEIIATYNKSAEIQCQIKIKIPADYPLKSVQVDIGDQLSLKKAQVRKWTLSIRNLLQSRNGDIITAILQWKSNIDRELEGIEECFICYSVQHATDKSLPSMQCRNCQNKFHVACIRKWFNTSNKSNCPLCQTFFFQ